MIVILPSGEERLETIEQFHKRRWEEIEGAIRTRRRAARGEQLLLTRYCDLYGASKSAVAIWMLNAGLPLDEIIPEIKCSRHGKLRKPLRAWLDKVRSAHDDLELRVLRDLCNAQNCTGDHVAQEVPCGLDLSALADPVMVTAS